MKPTVVVIDYLKGNLKSVEQGLAKAGAKSVVTSDAERIARASALVLPGVGAFGDAALTMETLGQFDAIHEALSRGASFLGICLGLHLMFETGDEWASDDETATEPPRGLGLIAGCCPKLPQKDAIGQPFKIPHVGWNTIVPVVDGAAEASEDFSHCALLENVAPNTYFYFTHSYRAPDNDATVAYSVHSERFPSVVALEDRIFGVQFHPEKSSDAGGLVLQNFVRNAAALA